MEIRTDLSECPHCGGKTALAEDARLRWVCATCGGPRVPGASGKSRALSRARAAQAAAFGWSAGAIALSVSAALLAGLAALLWSAAAGPSIAVGVIGVLLLLFGWRASARAGAQRKELTRRLDEAWREGARAILAERGRDTTAAQLAEAMSIDEGEADDLLTQLAAHDEARVAIDDGAVKFRVERDAAPAEEEGESGENEKTKTKSEGA